MKPLVWLMLLTCLAVPVLAQDDGDGGGGGGDDFFDLGSMGGFADVGRDFDALAEVRNILARANIPAMDKTQEKEVKKIYDREVKIVGKPYEKLFGVPLKTAMGALQPTGGGRGRRGGNFRRPESLQVSEARRLSQLLVDKMIAGLRIFDQQGPLRRSQSEQIRAAKLSILTGSLTAAGTPLTQEQLTEAEAVLARESRVRALLIVESKGEPYQDQMFQLEAQTTLRLTALLDPQQKATYAAATSNLGAPAFPRPAARRGN
jgi:hypothetical protein